MVSSIKYFYPLLASILLVLLLAECARNPAAPTPVATSTKTVPTPEEALELGQYFEGVTGAFVLYDLNNDHYTHYNPERCSERFLPASTFKIMLSLIGLETGVIPDENYVIKWDGTKHDIPAWNQDHTLKTAIRDSVEWYYQELAQRVGKEEMQEYINAVGYGNSDISGQSEVFWLDGTLKISADEQIEFLKRLYREDLPFSERSIKIVKEIMLLEKTDAFRMSGKTGSGQMDGFFLGWFVGFLEEEHNVYFFAANLEGTSPDVRGPKAREIVLNILRELELLP